MNTGTVTRISSQRTPFGEVFLEIFIGDKPYFTRQRTIGIMAMSAM